MINTKLVERAVISEVAYIGEKAVCIWVRLATHHGPKYVWSAHEPWKESDFAFIQILVIAGWIFVGWFFEKINKMRTQRPGRKAKSCREQGS